MTERIIIKKLWKYGHFHNPDVLNVAQVVGKDVPKLRLKDRVVAEALRSYQDLMFFTLQPLSHLHHGRDPVADGSLGPATVDLFNVPRCEVPDFGFGSTAIGTGSWPEPCQKAGVKFHVNKSGMPSSITGNWATLQGYVVRAYGLIGLRMIEVMSAAEANIQTYFGSFFGSTIGLAQFNSGSCSGKVTCKLSSRYVGENAGLLKHEWGHNNNLSHTRGGTMNPSILKEPDPEAKWLPSDPSYSTLVRFFGGTPVDVPLPTWTDFYGI